MACRSLYIYCLLMPTDACTSSFTVCQCLGDVTASLPNPMRGNLEVGSTGGGIYSCQTCDLFFVEALDWKFKHQADFIHYSYQCRWLLHLLQSVGVNHPIVSATVTPSNVCVEVRTVYAQWCPIRTVH